MPDVSRFFACFKKQKNYQKKKKKKFVHLFVLFFIHFNFIQMTFECISSIKMKIYHFSLFSINIIFTIKTTIEKRMKNRESKKNFILYNQYSFQFYHFFKKQVCFCLLKIFDPCHHYLTLTIQIV